MHPNILVLVLIAWGLLGLGVLLGFFLRRGSGKSGPGPDTRIQRALRASEDHQERLEGRKPPVPPATTTRVFLGDQELQKPPPIPYQRLRDSRDAREAAHGPETREIVMPTPELIAADRASAPEQPAPVSTGAGDDLLSMTVPELMAKVEAEATQVIPKITDIDTGKQLKVEATPDRRVHAELADGSVVVRYERAGKWFHEGPGLRRKVTLPEAVALAHAPGARVHHGLPGGHLFETKLRHLREEAVR